ncbi:kinetochore complex Sim4 subunit Fta1-domain-containing protein [Apodospora peruviana]|uniref:Kinetochore complex Sim4 subunit Fta1-domain-containing protein n=1 Tax=Apodospora peruviana TaxID=516989 RepID=A0AAE0LYQ4_9PEZI|nr:kinetochore complex Sim4 subunit Fta1-domain-containing protein [Apodospora peruviana]
MATSSSSASRKRRPNRDQDQPIPESPQQAQQARRRPQPTAIATATATTTRRVSSQSQEEEPSQLSDLSGTAGSSSADVPLPPFYNTTFSAHRVSPLYIGKEELTSQRLAVLAQRLRDILVGDVVRGVEVGLLHNNNTTDDGGVGAMGRAGALEAVGISWVSMAGVLDLGATTKSDWKAATAVAELRRKKDKKKGIHIMLRYENADCTALLVPELEPTASGVGDNNTAAKFYVGGNNDDDDDRQQQQQQETVGKHFVNLPLLLLRMPAPLKVVVADFLSSAFDCRVSSLRLGTRSMVRSWESWIRAAGLPTRGPLAKDVAISLGFWVPPPPAEEGGNDEDGHQQLGLKSIDIIIPVAELRGFVDAGSANITSTQKRKWAWEDDLRKRRKLAGRLYEEGWEWRRKDTASTEEQEDDGEEGQPFTEALGRYIDHHLGLNLFHPGVRVTRIACGGFVMSEARLKVFAPADLGEETDAASVSSSPGQRGAVLELLSGLVNKAKAAEFGFASISQ